jgi:hypothetical protein
VSAERTNGPISRRLRDRTPSFARVSTSLFRFSPTATVPLAGRGGR